MASSASQHEFPESLCFARDPSLPSSWKVFRYECLPMTTQKTTHIQLTGCEATVFKSGPRKGQTKFLSKQSGASFIFDIAEYSAAAKIHEKKQKEAANGTLFGS